MMMLFTMMIIHDKDVQSNVCVSDKADLAVNSEQRLLAAGNSTHSTDLLKGQARNQQC